MKQRSILVGGRLVLPALAAFLPVGILVFAGAFVTSPSASAVAPVTKASTGKLPATRPQPVTKTIVIKKGDSLSKVLLNLGVNQTEVLGIIDTVSKYYKPTLLQPGQTISLSFDPEVPFYLLSLHFQIDRLRELTVTRDENQNFSAAISARRTLVRDEAITGKIQSSLYADGLKSGVPVQVLMQMIDMYGFNIDFQRDIAPGDQFSVLWQERVDTDGKPVQPGNLLMGRLVLRDRTLTMYGFTGSSGHINYFDPRGLSVRKALLKTPIPGAPITSPFGWRINPIYGGGYTDFHRGVDFGAYPGTPIRAGGNGVVEYRGFDPIYGNHVMLRHVNGYESIYAHMQRYAQGLHVGEKVEQGQVIGYVGSTGESTGPHVHYEVHLWGRPVNPETLNFPPQQILAGPELNAFLIHEQILTRKLHDLIR
jgi:murein DD-endopeptidase MepM/ murein hydrolase activator NlpD